MSKVSESKVSESRGYHEFVRIGRPDVLCDQRTNYKIDAAAYQQYLNDRKSLDHTLSHQDEEKEENLPNIIQ